ncbi:MAG: HDIG domain-containing protein [candidate division Zixibacteria bacterium]|jgi:putative nucleotidyltransferase with HDIG domain|nr:HDIG domain-containing protein [candidate division Zixibacteria bacterium]
MPEEVYKLWPELEWIKDEKLREQTADAWALALKLSPLTVDDLNEIPFTLLIKDCPVTFMEHKRAVVHLSYESAQTMQKFFGTNLPIDLDTVVAGAILADVGKLLEYEKIEGKAVQSDFGKAVRHPFSGVGLAMQCGVPKEVCHIIAAHAGEGDMVKRTTEAYIVHHCDFMSFLPFKNL